MTDHRATVKRFDMPYVIFAVGGMLQREGSQTMVRAEDYDALHAEVEALRQERDVLLNKVHVYETVYGGDLKP